MAGRQTDLTPETQEKIVSAIKSGNYASVAAAYAGITERTFYNWMAWGRASEDEANIYFQFLHAVTCAEAEAEVRAVALVNRAMSDDWRAAIEYIRRKFPHRWNPPQGIKLSDLTAEQLLAIARGGEAGIESPGDQLAIDEQSAERSDPVPE